MNKNKKKILAIRAGIYAIVTNKNLIPKNAYFYGGTENGIAETISFEEAVEILSKMGKDAQKTTGKKQNEQNCEEYQQCEFDFREVIED